MIARKPADDCKRLQVGHAPGLPGWFEDELLSFPVGEHDDGADALAYAFQALGMTEAKPLGFKVPGL
ncbi:MAG: hypothetical protein WAW42_17210 [Candidatus Competibacteraceae bacterium]